MSVVVRYIGLSCFDVPVVLVCMCVFAECAVLARSRRVPVLCHHHHQLFLWQSRQHVLFMAHTLLPSLPPAKGPLHAPNYCTRGGVILHVSFPNSV